MFGRNEEIQQISQAVMLIGGLKYGEHLHDTNKKYAVILEHLYDWKLKLIIVKKCQDILNVGLMKTYLVLI